MKIVMIGSGSLGSLVGGGLAMSGLDLWFIDVWKEHVDCLNDRGLKLIDLNGNENYIPVKAVHADNIAQSGLNEPDLIVLLVKAYDTRQALHNISDILGSHTKILTLQNGLGNHDVIKEYFSEDNIFIGVTNMGAFLIEPGVVQQGGDGLTTLGNLKGTVDKNLIDLASVFSKAGFTVSTSDDINTLIWDKLVVNVGVNALAALYQLPSGMLLEYESTRTLMRLLILEAAEIASACKISLSYEDPVEHVTEVARATAKNYCSMVLDIKKNTRTEIDFINGAIVKKGEEVGIATPYNEMISLIIRVLEQQSNRSKSN